MTEMEYVIHSIETNLFFLRIIKEHLIFTIAALMPRDQGMVPELEKTINNLEELLKETVLMANGVVPTQNLMFGDIVTPYTLKAEMVTQYYTGIKINTNITQMEVSLLTSIRPVSKTMPPKAVSMLNQRIMALLEKIIQTKKMVLSNVLSCKMFTTIYPLMLDHVTREAEHYLQLLQRLESSHGLLETPRDAAGMEAFWDNIMGEHGKFIRGLLDPSEENLIQQANEFVNIFTELTNTAKMAINQLELLPQVTSRSVEATTDIKNFKEQGTEGILDCKIRSIILPLLSDHVLREANHFLKELRMVQKIIK
ncbi:DUF2935 domain-containing protein [Ruminiclostridium cellulolyticum]|uniref:DUF2935 domain-containing protein n=1 Tax=Ruminiclostridium cellulolyticum (strain ATCC 35319 / DSM 5812 / JCM 6584 / H10) TaxID=394503 RepID=B8I667_RUMCH|nr:DUF2935 domain-containing protein [Ruminiclostridium cellulolyticum]ACL76832.1 conserved hypothetical protein [Ruminiclostridium cellulolyticum H10]